MSEKFLAQVDKAVKIANIKYPPEDGFKVIWIFDNSNAYSDDDLIAAHTNAKAGEKQAIIRYTIWDGKPQRMVFNIGVPKGLIQVLKERSRYHQKMKLEDMRKDISSHQDFLNKKTKMEHFYTIVSNAV